MAKMVSDGEYSITFTADRKNTSGLFVIKGPGGESQKTIRLNCAPPFVSPKFTKAPEDAKITTGMLLILDWNYYYFYYM